MSTQQGVPVVAFRRASMPYRLTTRQEARSILFHSTARFCTGQPRVVSSGTSMWATTSCSVGRPVSLLFSVYHNPNCRNLPNLWHGYSTSFSVWWQSGDNLVSNVNVTAIRSQKTADNIERRGLAGTIRSDQSRNGAFSKLQ